MMLSSPTPDSRSAFAACPGVDSKLGAGDSNTAHPTRDFEDDRAVAGMVLRADNRH